MERWVRPLCPPPSAFCDDFPSPTACDRSYPSFTLAHVLTQGKGEHTERGSRGSVPPGLYSLACQQCRLSHFQPGLCCGLRAGMLSTAEADKAGEKPWLGAQSSPVSSRKPPFVPPPHWGLPVEMQVVRRKDGRFSVTGKNPPASGSHRPG